MPRLPRTPSRCRRPIGRRRASGFTLIEVGLVVGLLSVIAILVANYYVNSLSIRHAERRVEGAVRDVRAIVNASIAWKESNVFGYWPNDLNAITIMQLQEDGYLSDLPANRFLVCGANDCGPYVLLGWDRDPGGTPPGDYTDDFMEAEDLVVRFHVWGRDAVSIAAQLPLGRATKLPGAGEEHVVEVRVTREGVAERFVRLRNEGRELVFAQGEVGGVEFPLGDLQGVARIARAPQPDDPAYDVFTGDQTSGVAIELTPVGVELVDGASRVNVLETFGLIATDVDRIEHEIGCIRAHPDAPTLVTQCVDSYAPEPTDP